MRLFRKKALPDLTSLELNTPIVEGATRYFCLGCHRQIGVQINAQSDRDLRAALNNRCPYCGRKLDRSSTHLGYR